MAGLVSWRLMPTRASPRDVSGCVDVAPSRKFRASVVAGDVLVEGLGQILVLILQVALEGL
jgi:hypothetical protein